MQECKLKKCGDCEHYDVLDRYCEMKHSTRRFGAVTEACEYFADAREISDILREAEIVPVVTERDETEQSETEHDAVNSPSHYCQGGIECIEALKAATVNLKGIEAVCTANAIKYLWRWKEKNGAEDLNKSIWYIKRLIQEVSENG